MTGCSVDGCERGHHSHGLCQLHARRLRMNGDVHAVRRPARVEAACSVDGCDRDHHAHGLCASHYKTRHDKRRAVALEDEGTDDRMLRLAQSAIAVGWSPALACWYVPVLWEHWPPTQGLGRVMVAQAAQGPSRLHQTGSMRHAQVGRLAVPTVGRVRPARQLVNA